MNTSILKDIFYDEISIKKNVINLKKISTEYKNQNQVNSSYSFQWNWVADIKEREKAHEMQKKWYLELYGFNSEIELSKFLRKKEIIFDAGCGLGYKAAWFADLSPSSIVIAMDYSDSINYASKEYKHLKNLFFIRGDIANTGFKENVINYVSCDQVLQHTENPEETFAHLTKITKNNDVFSCYVYAEKALPRELLDEYFRKKTHEIDRNDLLDLSKQLTELGKTLTDLNIKINFPEIPLLGIKGGKQDLQRFFYWNFLKCYWNEELGQDISTSTNFDWYSPSNATRYSEDEFKDLIKNNNLEIEHFHSEEACYSGRFIKKSIL